MKKPKSDLSTGSALQGDWNHQHWLKLELLWLSKPTSITLPSLDWTCWSMQSTMTMHKWWNCICLSYVIARASAAEELQSSAPQWIRRAKNLCLIFNDTSHFALDWFETFTSVGWFGPSSLSFVACFLLLVYGRVAQEPGYQATRNLGSPSSWAVPSPLWLKRALHHRLG